MSIREFSARLQSSDESPFLAALRKLRGVENPTLLTGPDGDLLPPPPGWAVWKTLEIPAGLEPA